NDLINHRRGGLDDQRPQRCSTKPPCQEARRKQASSGALVVPSGPSDNDQRTLRYFRAMSALPPKADMCGATRDVRIGPIAVLAVLSCSTPESGCTGGRKFHNACFCESAEYKRCASTY